MVVEDHPLNMTLLKSALGDRMGCDMVATTNVAAALAELEKHRDIGLLITDLHLPGVSGLELIRRMRACPKLSKVPVIVCTMDSSVDTVVEVASLGVDFFIRKPIKPTRLYQAMRDALRGGPVRPRTRLQVMLALGIELDTYERLIDSAGRALLAALQGGDDEEERFSVPNETDLKTVARLIWPEVWSRMANLACEAESHGHGGRPGDGESSQVA